MLSMISLLQTVYQMQLKNRLMQQEKFKYEYFNKQ
jgi:hypothetical protein